LCRARKAGISAEIYPDIAKIKKQMQYANDNSIPFVAIIGENEIKNQSVTLKNMATGEQKLIKIEKLVAEFLT
jgi:histidyl-tRNA synthetase